MHRLLSIIFVFSINCVLIFNIYAAHAEDNSKSTDLILNSAEKFFISLKNGEYEIVWNLLSDKSHKTIINDVHKASKKMNRDINKEDIAEDFNNGGVMFNNYWGSFRSTFDTEMILEQTRWDMGFIKKHKAEIIISNKKSERPARLKMLKENEVWKIGLVETFWNKKRMRFMYFISNLFNE